MTTQDPPVTPNTFHCFPRLPAELQLMVWEWAALSLHTERGAHFFSVQFLSFAEREKAKAPRVDWQIVRRCREKRTWDKWDEYPHDHSKLTPDAAYWRIMAPHWDRTKEPSYIPPQNPSTYMIGDLWAACPDSRRAFLNRMKKVRRSVARQLKVATTGADPHHENLLEMNGTFLKGANEQMPFTLYPQRDLVCFQTPLPPTYRPNKWSIYSGFDIPFRRPEHSALEFDPSWELDIKTVPSYGGGADTWLAEILGCFLRATSGCNAHPRLWFIDYRLRRNEWKPEVEKPWTLAPGCHVFRGHGCKFVDISSSYEYWETRSQPQDAPTGTYYHVHDFVRNLEDRIEDLSVSIDWRFLNSRYPVGHHRRHERPFVKVGILACVWE
ncbi:hypothetical protein PG987_007881 [Apiospora arundinis]